MVNGFPLYISDTLAELWGKGYCTVGAATFQSAGYVARYVMKKVTGASAEDHYTRIDPETGEITHLKPEYVTMSRRPGIGRPWLDKYKKDVFPHDYVVIDGRKVKPPSFYDRCLEIDDPDLLGQIKRARIQNNRRFASDQTPERLEVRAKVLEAKVSQLRRTEV
jgi:hypothetical protein